MHSVAFAYHYISRACLQEVLASGDGVDGSGQARQGDVIGAVKESLSTHLR